MGGGNNVKLLWNNEIETGACIISCIIHILTLPHWITSLASEFNERTQTKQGYNTTINAPNKIQI